jgi:AraC-like DNA-binding protein
MICFIIKLEKIVKSLGGYVEREEKILNPMGYVLDALEEGVGKIHIPQPVEPVKTDLVRDVLEKRHLHPYPEMFIQIKEATIFSFKEGDYSLNQGDLALIPPMTPHPERAGGEDKNFLNLVIMASPAHVTCHLARAKTGIPSINESVMRRTSRGEKIIALERIIIDLYRREERELMLPLLKTIFFYLKELFIFEINGVNRLSEKVMRACSVIRTEIANPMLNGKYLAAQLGCSRDYLSHLFHREMGERLSSYITRERIVQAKTLLTDTGFNCSETAWACGFSQAAYFNRVFKEQTGVTPREYKKRK